MNRQIVHFIEGHGLHHGIQRIQRHRLARHVNPESAHLIARIIPDLSLGDTIISAQDLQQRHRSPADTRVSFC